MSNKVEDPDVYGAMPEGDDEMLEYGDNLNSK